MTEKMKVLNDGTEIPQDAFGAIFGGGLKKALHVKRKLKVDGQDFIFTIADMQPLQELVDTLVAENLRLQKQLDLYADAKIGAFGLPVVKRPRGRPRKHPLPVTQAEKPRYRVKVGQIYTKASA